MEVSFSMEKTITVIEEGERFGKVYEVKFSDLPKLAEKYNKVDAKFPSGVYERRIKQLEDVGYKVVEVVWPKGEEKHHTAKVIVER